MFASFAEAFCCVCVESVRTLLASAFVASHLTHQKLLATLEFPLLACVFDPQRLHIFILHLLQLGARPQTVECVDNFKEAPLYAL